MLIDLILRHNTTELCWMTMCVCCAAMREQSNAHQSDESNNAQQYDSQTSDEQHTAPQSYFGRQRVRTAAMREHSNAHQPEESNNAQQSDIR